MPLSAERQQLVERLPLERRPFRRALHLDEPAVAGLDDVHVDVGARILVVGEIEHRHAADDADARGGDVVLHRIALICPLSRILCSASTSATKPPVIDAVRVPPSAWMTSQSTQIVRSPSSVSRATDRSDRPIRRWISCVRPPTLPAVASRCVRVDVARGSMPYSAVTQPLPVLRRNGGTRSSTLAVQMTRVARLR